MLTTLYIDFFRRPRAANSVVGDWIWQKFKPIQALMVVLVTYKNEEIIYKDENSIVLTITSIIILWRFFLTFKDS